MLDAPEWTAERLEADRNRAIEVFRGRRMEEPLERYLESFDRYQGVVEDLLETTVDLSDVSKLAGLTADRESLEALRYVSGPPISEDDLKTLAEAVLTPSRLKKDPRMADRVVAVVMQGLDRRRFPWVKENWEPNEAQRNAAVLASAALMATQRLATERRTEEKRRQEQEVREALTAADLKEVEPRAIEVLAKAPGAGQFCGESYLGNRKADIVVGLGDGRTLPVECKVSNSATNSVKRLNNDAVVKAVYWRQQFGSVQVVPAAVLSGVYKLHNLRDAQEKGLCLFWAHDLDRLVQWITATGE